MKRSGENVHARRRILSNRKMLFCSWGLSVGADEEGVGMSCTASDYEITAAAVLNYFRHVLSALSRMFKRTLSNLISRPNA